jgi:EAL domain-containing protein (putative c-di-GMP-specific phosphodiesterase class I)
VNLSAQLLHHPRLAEQVAAALEMSGLAPQHLVLEITESALLQDARSAAVELPRVKELGVRLALDDFGTGDSSLSHLLRFPIDIIKIDRSFVSAIGGDDTTADLALGLVMLGRTMQVRTVAEGVEDENRLLALRQAGCESAQGFHFSPALPHPTRWSAPPRRAGRPNPGRPLCAPGRVAAIAAPPASTNPADPGSAATNAGTRSRGICWAGSAIGVRSP